MQTENQGISSRISVVDSPSDFSAGGPLFLAPPNPTLHQMSIHSAPDDNTTPYFTIVPDGNGGPLCVTHSDTVGPIQEVMLLVPPNSNSGPFTPHSVIAHLMCPHLILCPFMLLPRNNVPLCPHLLIMSHFAFTQQYCPLHAPAQL